jgi:nicotinamidase-related amidase
MVGMTSLTDRPAAALVVVDAQNQVIGDAWSRDAVVATIRDLVVSARAAGAPVVWIQQTDEEFVEGTAGWDLVEGLEPAEGEPRLQKAYNDSFEGTGLDDVLADAGAGHVIVVGGQTDACIRATLYGALHRGYDATLVADAHTTEDTTQWGNATPEDIVRHTNVTWDGIQLPGRIGRTIAAAEIAF